MNRYLIVVGDAPACGGAVLPYEGDPPSTINGHRIALIGGRVQCEGCRSVGVIAKAGGPYRMLHCGVEQALEGDVVLCGCPVPPLLIAKRQRLCSCDDRSGMEGGFVATTVRADWYTADTKEASVSKKVADAAITREVALDAEKTICPGVSDHKFFQELMKARDRALHLVRWKIGHLNTWDQAARDAVYTWFHENDEDTRSFLHKGLLKVTEVLNDLTTANFVSFPNEFIGKTSCLTVENPGVVAAVCKSDTNNRIIGIAPGFCRLYFESANAPSKVGTLIHEVAHFDDVFSADDIVYSHTWSRRLAEQGEHWTKKNADSISGYVMWGSYYGM